MKKSQYSAEQIVRILDQAAAGGSPVEELCRQHGISRATFYNWRRKYSGMDKEMVRDYRKLQQENNQLRSLVADLTLANKALEVAAGKKP